MAAERENSTPKQKQQYWQTHSQGYEASGLTQAAYCEQHRLNLKTFAYWRHRLKADAVPVKLVQVPTLQRQPAGMIRFMVNGYAVEVGEGFSAASLRELVFVLRGL